MSEWISIKDRLPGNYTQVIVRVRSFFFWWKIKRALYINKYFVMEGMNITNRVSQWQPVDIDSPLTAATNGAYSISERLKNDLIKRHKENKND